MYVDDILLTCVEGWIEECNKKLAVEFYMNDLGMMHYYMGLKVWQEPNEVYLGQGKYVLEILKKFNMMDYKTMTTSMTIILRRLGSSQ